MIMNAFEGTGLEDMIRIDFSVVSDLNYYNGIIFKGFVEKLSEEKGRMSEFRLYSMVERLAPEVIAKERRIYKGVSANVDFYSGFVYRMLDLPDKLYTPIFAIARIAGWSAHRMEELVNSGKIIRPAYLNVHERVPYVGIDHR